MNLRPPSARVVFAALLVTIAGCDAPDDGNDPESLGDSAEAVKAAPSLAAPKPGGVSFGRDETQRQAFIPIAGQAFGKARVLHSVKLEDLGANEDLLLRGEFTLSTCGAKDISGDASDGEKNPCSTPELKRSAYTYSPHFAAYFALADSPNDTKGDKVSSAFDTTCNHREHHCTVVLPETRVKGRAAKTKYVNLVVGADDKGARSFDLMDVEDDHGQLAVTRIAQGAGGIAIDEATKDSLKKGSIDIDREEGDGGPLGADPKEHHVIYRVALKGLKPGDVVSADAKLVAKTKGGPAACDALFVSEVVLSADANPEKKSAGDEHVTQKNGQNCTEHSGGDCVYKKSGAVRLGPKAPSTMFASLVVTAGRTCAPPGFVWEAQSGGALEVDVRR